MPAHTTNYTNTFISVAPDCPVNSGTVPTLRGGKKTIAGLQYDMLIEAPYRFTSDDVLFTIYANRNDWLESEWEVYRTQFFSKGQPCLRASPLTKKFGWGVHHNEEGQIALYGMETEAYRSLASRKNLQQVKAMRSKR